MTDFHCLRCRRRVRIYVHAKVLVCEQCQRRMRPGVGGRTFPAEYELRELSDDRPEFEVRGVW